MQLLLILLNFPRKGFFLPVYAFSSLLFPLGSFSAFPSVCQNDHLITHVVPITPIMVISFYYFFLPHLGTCWGISVPQPGIKAAPPHWKHTVLSVGLPGKSQWLQIPGQTIPAWAPHGSLVLRLALYLWNKSVSPIFSQAPDFLVRSHTSFFLLDLYRGAFRHSGWGLRRAWEVLLLRRFRFRWQCRQMVSSRVCPLWVWGLPWALYLWEVLAPGFLVCALPAHFSLGFTSGYRGDGSWRACGVCGPDSALVLGLQLFQEFLGLWSSCSLSNCSWGFAA